MNPKRLPIILPPPCILEDRGCSSMAEPQPSKLAMWVRFPSPASVGGPGTPGDAVRCCSSAVERVLGKDEVLGSSPSSSFRNRGTVPPWFVPDLKMGRLH